MACPDVVLNGLVLDGATPDGDGIVWTVTQLTGWFDGADMSLSRQPVLPEGEVVTAVHVNARAVVLEANAASATPNSTPLGDDCYTAIETAKDAGRAIYLPVVMTVTDPANGALHANVRRTDGSSLKTAIQGALHSVQVQWLLLAEDPRRYEADNTTAHD